MLASVPANNSLEATLSADCKAEVVHDTAHKGLHGGHTASAMNRGIAFLGQGRGITNIFRGTVRPLHLK